MIGHWDAKVCRLSPCLLLTDNQQLRICRAYPAREGAAGRIIREPENLPKKRVPFKPLACRVAGTKTVLRIKKGNPQAELIGLGIFLSVLSQGKGVETSRRPATVIGTKAA